MDNANIRIMALFDGINEYEDYSKIRIENETTCPSCGNTKNYKRGSLCNECYYENKIAKFLYDKCTGFRYCDKEIDNVKNDIGETGLKDYLDMCLSCDKNALDISARAKRLQEETINTKLSEQNIKYSLEKAKANKVKSWLVFGIIVSLPFIIFGVKNTYQDMNSGYYAWKACKNDIIKRINRGNYVYLQDLEQSRIEAFSDYQRPRNEHFDVYIKSLNIQGVQKEVTYYCEVFNARFWVWDSNK
jgi:hypothetical protein